MGTRLDFVLTQAPSDPLLEIARAVLPLAASAPGAPPVFAHLGVSEFNGVRLLAAHLSGPAHPLPLSEPLAKALSVRLTVALHQWYSDSLGEAGYAVFENGVEVCRNDAPIPDGAPMYPRFREGLQCVFPSWSALGPEEVLDLIWSPEASYEVFELSRNGVPLSVPEPFQPVAPAAFRPSVFAKEFTWGRRPRSLVRGCAALFGVLCGLMFLWLAGWWLIEVLR